MIRFVSVLSVRRATLLLGISLLLLCACPSRLPGQNLESAASLSGVVTDPQTARVAGATVSIFNTGQNFTRVFKTDSSGTFSFTLLPPGEYSLKVESPGFKSYQQDRIVLEVGQAKSLTVEMTLGSSQETVEVTISEAPLLDSENANV